MYRIHVKIKIIQESKLKKCNEDVDLIIEE